MHRRAQCGQGTCGIHGITQAFTQRDDLCVAVTQQAMGGCELGPERSDDTVSLFEHLPERE
jgi:hypothetical protein